MKIQCAWSLVTSPLAIEVERGGLAGPGLEVVVEALPFFNSSLRGLADCERSGSKAMLIYTKVKTKDSTCSHFVPLAMPFPKRFLKSL